MVFDLLPGMQLPVRTHKVDQQLVDLYARVSGDHNPLHTNPEFAATTHFGRTIAHGMMTLAFLSQALEIWAGAAWSNGGAIDVTFLSPVYPGDEVTVSATVVEPDAPGTFACAVEVTVGDRKIVAGTARWPSGGAAA